MNWRMKMVGQMVGELARGCVACAKDAWWVNRLAVARPVLVLFVFQLVQERFLCISILGSL